MTELPPPITPCLEPAAKELAEATDPHPRIYEVPPEQGREILLGLQSDPSVPRPDVDEEWVDVDAGRWGTVRTRIIRPRGATGPLPVVFFIHGAGWVFGDDRTHDRLFRELAVGAGAAGVFPVYDRAPEAKYPTQVEQNYAVGQWVLEHGAEHGLDTSRAAVTGESVGGCMSAVFALMNKERGGIGLKAQVLLYPVTDADFDTPSYLQFAEGYYLTRDGMKWFWDAYTTDPAQRTEAHASPLRAPWNSSGDCPPPSSSPTRPTSCATRASSTPTSSARPGSTSPPSASRAWSTTSSSWTVCATPEPPTWHADSPWTPSERRCTTAERARHRSSRSHAL